MIPLLISFSAILLIFLLYKKNLKRILLRLIPVVIVYLVSTGFYFNLKFLEKTGPFYVLIDASPSMRAYLPMVMRQLETLKFENRKFFFSESVVTELPPDTIFGRFTDITTPLIKLHKDEPSAIILISDGNHNFGLSFDKRIEQVNTPVYVFGTGREAIKDAALFDVIYPEYVFMGDTFNIVVVVESQGFKEEKRMGLLKLTSENLEFSKQFPLSDIPAKNNIEFKIPAKRVGEVKFKIALLPLSAEINLSNNERNISLNVLEKKISALYYTHHLSFNTKFILHNLQKNEILSLSAVVYLPSGKYEKILNNRANISNLSQFDILILDNVSGERLPWDDLPAFLRDGGGILFVGSIQEINDLLREILPIEITGKQLNGEFKMKVLKNFSVLSPLNEYLPFSTINQALGAKKGCVTIAETENLPLIGYMFYHNGVVFQINVVDFGVWGFSQLNLKNRDFFSPLLNDIVKLLSPWGRKERLILRVPQSEYTIGEKINFTLLSYDRNLLLASGCEFYLNFGGEKIPFFEVQNGIYEATYLLKKSGEYEVYAQGYLGEEELKSRSLKLKIKELMVEEEEVINERLLREIAYRTGGSYHLFSEIDNFQPPTRERKSKIKRITLDSPLLYLTIFLLFVFDWILRKREGLV